MIEPVLHLPFFKGKPNSFFLLLVFGSIVDIHDTCYHKKLIFSMHYLISQLLGPDPISKEVSGKA